jgi:hypothetical protein
VGVTEGVVEIWINIHLAREIHWWHDTCEPHRHHEWQPFVMTIKESGCVVSHPSAYLPCDTWTSIRGWPTPYPIVYPLSDVRYRWSWQLSKLLSLQDPIIFYASVHNQSCSPGPDDQSSIDTDGDYHLQSSKHENRPLLTFPSGILHFPLVALPDLT